MRRRAGALLPGQRRARGRRIAVRGAVLDPGQQSGAVPLRLSGHVLHTLRRRHAVGAAVIVTAPDASVTRRTVRIRSLSAP